MSKVDSKLTEFATVRQLEYLEAIEKHGSIRAAATALGVVRGSIQDSMHLLRKKAAVAGYSPEHDMTRTAPVGFDVKGTSTLYDKDGKVSQQWVKTQRDHAETEHVIRKFIDGLVADARGLSPLIEAPVAAVDDLLVVYPLGDPHFGLSSWKDETGEAFDLEIAERLLQGAIDSLVSSAPAATTAILLNLGDFFHADNQSNRSNSGNQLDVAGRWAQVMQVGLRAMIYAIKRCLEKHQSVVVRNVKGNHDNHSSFALALALDAYFSNNGRVKVDLSPAPHWFYRFGKVLIGSTHGDSGKMANLPGVMACDRPGDWGETAYRYWYIGHVHHDEIKEFPGVTVESFRTLAARDAWHAGQGYRAGRDMRAIVHHREFGEIGRHRCDVAMLK